MYKTWIELVSCPKCGADFNEISAAKGNCLQCQCSWKVEDNILLWDVHSNKTYRSIFNTWLTRLKNQCHPLSNCLLPFRYIIKRQDERLYERTLSDPTMANEWANHYLQDISLDKNDNVLDLGCGRGRCIAMMTQLGFKITGQDIYKHNWWEKIAGAHFQVVPPHYDKLPWREHSFSVILCTQVLHYLTEQQLSTYLSELYRILKPGGTCIMLEANHLSYGANVSKKQIGRLHSLASVQQVTHSIGFKQLSLNYEGFFAPVFPLFINFIRQLFTQKTCSFDFGSKLEQMIPMEKRRLWLLKIQKPVT